MLKHLQYRLTATFTLLTGIVLSVLLWVAFVFSTKQANQNFHQNILSVIQNVEQRLRMENTVSVLWIANLEQQNKMLFYIEDSNLPAFSSKVERGEDWKEMVSNAKQTAAEKNFFCDRAPLSTLYTETIQFQINQNGIWNVILKKIPAPSGWYTLIAFADNTKLYQSQMYILALYTGLWLAGIVLLAIVNFFLAKWALKPTEQSLQKQVEFVAAASHELKSPLAVLNASITALEPKDESQEQLQTCALREVQRMSRLVSDLLDLARSDTAAWNLQWEIFRPDTLLIELWEQFLPVAQEQNRNLQLVLPQTLLPFVYADPMRVSQILVILLSNAMQHTEKGTPIEICTHYYKNTFQIQICDHGKGIDKQNAEKVFERFYRGDMGRTDKNHFGLGLSIAKELAQMQKTKLFFCPTPQGGTTFILEFSIGGISKNKENGSV